MSYYWLEGVEEYIGNEIEAHGLDPKKAWTEVLEMAKDNLTPEEAQ